jgi:hypothetical protein
MGCFKFLIENQLTENTSRVIICKNHPYWNIDGVYRSSRPIFPIPHTKIWFLANSRIKRTAKSDFLGQHCLGFEKNMQWGKTSYFPSFFLISGPLCHILIVYMALRKDFYSMLVIYFEKARGLLKMYFK